MLEHRRIVADGSAIHVVESGRSDAPAIVFLHGWPQCWAAFAAVMQQLGDAAHCFAIDLPGIGGSQSPPRANDKRTLARHVRSAIETLGLRDVTLVGHDVGGMIAYAYLREFPDTLARAAILDVVIPGVEPWSAVIGNPQIWHFGFHAVPDLPEQLVRGREAAYFNFFFDAIAGSPTAIDARARAEYVAAYGRLEALHTGFEWYRAFARDAIDNAASLGRDVATPVLYARGERAPGELANYVQGLQDAGLRNAHGLLIPDSGHFSPDEQPERVAAVLRRFLGAHRPAR